MVEFSERTLLVALLEREPVAVVWGHTGGKKRPRVLNLLTVRETPTLRQRVVNEM
jgi:hypothetical protein